MKVDRIDLRNMRNGEHIQYFTDFRTLVDESNDEILKIKPQMDVFKTVFAREGEAMNKISKSPLTVQIKEADRDRDDTFRGMADANLSATRHFTPSVREAALRLQIVFDTYGNITRKAVAEQTAAVDSLLTEFFDKHKADVDTVGLGPWMQALDTKNTVLSNLMRDRYDEIASQTGLVLRQVRKEADEAYRKVIERIDALMIVEGSEEIANFIKRLNAIIGRANAIMEIRRGRGNSQEHAGKPGFY